VSSGLEQLFHKFEVAVRNGDATAYAKLSARDVGPQIQRFRANSERVRQGKWALALSRIEHQGQLATLFFEVRDNGGTVLDVGSLVASEEPEGWRIRSL